MNSIDTFKRDVGGRAVTVRVIRGLDLAGAVWLDGEIVVGRCATEEATEARIKAALAAASSNMQTQPQ